METDPVEVARCVRVPGADQTEAVHVFREEIVGTDFRILVRHQRLTVEGQGDRTAVVGYDQFPVTEGCLFSGQGGEGDQRIHGPLKGDISSGFFGVFTHEP